MTTRLKRPRIAVFLACWLILSQGPALFADWDYTNELASGKWLKVYVGGNRDVAYSQAAYQNGYDWTHQCRVEPFVVNGAYGAGADQKSCTTGAYYSQGDYKVSPD